jgi:hypothetical protein
LFTMSREISKRTPKQFELEPCDGMAGWDESLKRVLGNVWK